MGLKMKSRAKKKDKPFEVPAYMRPREPEPLSPLAAFINSLEGELDYIAAVVEFQENWCDHKPKRQMLLSVTACPGEERFEYTLTCIDCGIERKRQGRPPRERR